MNAVKPGEKSDIDLTALLPHYLMNIDILPGVNARGFLNLTI